MLGTWRTAKVPIPGIGWYATCSEPGGLRFGLIQVDSLSGSTAQLGGRSAARAAAQLEEIASAGTLASANDLVADFDQEVEHLSAFLRELAAAPS